MHVRTRSPKEYQVQEHDEALLSFLTTVENWQLPAPGLIQRSLFPSMHVNSVRHRIKRLKALQAQGKIEIPKHVLGKL